MARSTRSPDDFLPMKPTPYLILLALAEGSRHGYALMKEIDRLTDHKVRLNPGPLYRALDSCVELGLIEIADERPEPVLDDERRVYYRLTRVGRSVLGAETDRLGRLVAGARRLGVAGREGTR
ncbi:MAG TPA: PadR family transcriptional regulator [Vicinamibacterales bacterium]|nr:PadR family transcriptional regulator [Vicinamibacterales bacterium]